MKSFKWVPLMLVFTLFSFDVAYGCVCKTPNVPKAFKQAKAVFAGEVISITNRRARFKVEQSWKGVLRSDITLMMGGSVINRSGTTRIEAAMTTCDIEFKEGEKYLVYAAGSGKYLRAFVCSRTALLSSAGNDLQQLGPGKTPKSTSTSGVTRVHRRTLRPSSCREFLRPHA